jgi:hypothetical protein
MILRETLVDADIPHRDKMRECIMSQWKKSFDELTVQLAVSLSNYLSNLIELTLI